MFLSTQLTFILILGGIPLVYSHADVKSPPIRTPGPSFLTACGQTSFNEVQQDATGHIEEQEPVTAGCDLTLCRGMQFSDQPSSNIQSVTPGQQMTMQIDCTIPHGGPANVSLIDTTVGGSGKAIGPFLATFDNFCPTSGPTPANQSNLQFTLPDASTIGSSCQNAGDCLVQLFWATPDFSQNYYYCVDVAMNNNKAVASPAPSSATTAPSQSVSVAPGTVAPSLSSSGFQTSALPTSSGTSTGTAPNSSKSSAARRRMRILWF